MGRRGNFLVLVKGETLSINSKAYLVKILNPGKDYYIDRYRDTYLPFTSSPGMVEPVLYNELSDGTVTLSLTYRFIYYGLFVYEIKPKISEGVFEVKLKYYYHKMHDG